MVRRRRAEVKVSTLSAEQKRELAEAKDPICDLFTVGEVGLWSFGPCVCCRDPGDCLFLVPVWSGRIGFSKGFLIWKGFLVSDGK